MSHKQGTLVTIKFWQIKLKSYVILPGILISKSIDIDDLDITFYDILIIDPSSNKLVIHQTTIKPQPVSCP